MSEAKVAFDMRKIRVPLHHILPVRQVKDPQKRFCRYQTILASIREVGLIEPLMVHPQKGQPEMYLLVDGHLRHHALKELGEKAADCIIASDDESFTYNARISRLAPIQEHRMIVKAVQNGLKPERIAAALNIPLRMVKASMQLLDGIHEEVADLLKAKGITAKAIRLLTKVTGVRQIEIAELMVSANNYTASYVEALITGTSKDQLICPEKPKTKTGLAPEEIARMEQEMEVLERDFKTVEKGYGENVLNLTLAKGYTKKLIENARVARFLKAHYPDFLSEFEGIASAESI